MSLFTAILSRCFRIISYEWPYIQEHSSTRHQPICVSLSYIISYTYTCICFHTLKISYPCYSDLQSCGHLKEHLLYLPKKIQHPSLVSNQHVNIYKSKLKATLNSPKGHLSSKPQMDHWFNFNMSHNTRSVFKLHIDLCM